MTKFFQVIVVDWNKGATKFHPENSLILKKWKGADDDTSLLDLANLLQSELFIYIFDTLNEFKDSSKHVFKVYGLISPVIKV